MPEQVAFFYILTSIVVVLSWFFKRSRILFAIQIVWMIILLGGNTWSLDFPINEGLYYISASEDEWLTTGLLGWSYFLSTKILYAMGWSFFDYNLFMSSLSVLLIAYVFKKNAKNYTLAFSLIYLYPMAEIVIQKRFLPAMAIMLLALPYLTQRAWKSRIKFLLLWICAFGFHSSTVFFATFFFLDYFTRNGLTKKKRLLLIGMWLFLVLSMNSIPFFASLFFAEDKVQLYFVTFATKFDIWHFLYMLVMQSIPILLVHYIYTHTPQTQFSKMIYRLNLYSLFIIPFYMFDSVFIRYFRPVLLLDYIFLTNLFPEHLIASKKEVLAGGGIIMIAFVYTFLWYYANIGHQSFEAMIQPIFQDNMYLSDFWRNSQ